MRLLGICEPKRAQQIIIEAGKVRQGEYINDEVGAHHILFLRLRAYFSTVAFVAIENAAWFPLQDCEFMTDKLLMLIFQTFDGRFAPVSFYISAWNQTIKRWSDSIRTDGAILSTLVHATASWEHLWTCYRHADGADHRTAPTDNARNIFADDDAQTSKEAKLRDTIKKLPSERDQALSQREQARKSASKVNLVPNDRGGNDYGSGKRSRGY